MRARILGWDKINNSEYRFTTVIGIDINQKQNRSQQTRDKDIRRSIATVLKALKK